MSTLKQDKQALADIANKPAITADENARTEKKMPALSAHDAGKDARTMRAQASMEDVEPDDFEVKLGRVIAKSGAKMKEEAGGKVDEDFFGLLGDTFAGMAAFVRCMGAPVWIRPLLGCVGLVAATAPALIVYMRKKEKEGGEK